jgi:hypothetical protein
MIVRINATLSASQLSSLAFSPSDFAHILQQDFSIKIWWAYSDSNRDSQLRETDFKSAAATITPYAQTLVGNLGFEPRTFAV